MNYMGRLRVNVLKPFCKENLLIYFSAIFAHTIGCGKNRLTYNNCIIILFHQHSSICGGGEARES